MVVGKPGDRKSSTIDLAAIIARSSLPKEAFLPLAFSPETLFDEYDQDVGGRTDKLWLVDDANPILSDWQNDTNGERNAARFLRLYDCKDLSESYRRNREKNNPQSQRRLIPETSTSLVFGATFNLCMFRRQATRAGLQRRFLYYVAEKLARQILHPPQLDKELAEVAQAFKELSQLSGQFTFSDEAKALFETFQRNNRLQSDQANPLDEALCSRIASAPAQTLKVAMNFEASRAVYNGSGSLQLQANTIQLAIAHVETCHLAAQALEAISRRAVIANEAELLLERIRADFRSKAKNGAIILTRSELTRAYASHGHRDNRVEELYRHLIPRLIQIGDAKALPKNGKLERYAFRVEGK